METKKLYTLNREGTCRSERLPQALSDGYVKIDERSLTDLVRQSAEYAQYVKYYNDHNFEEADGWCAFFEEIYDYEKKQVKFSSIEDLERETSTSPHLTLFLTFLRLFGIAQESLNSLTEKHLDFYYREILQIKSRPEIPDSVPLFFELSKPAQQVMIPSGTLFEAGKDKNGKPLHYATKNDLIVNKATIEDVIDSVSKETIRYGLAFASPVLNLKDGDRTIVINTNNKYEFSSFFEAEYSSGEGWEKAAWEGNTNTIKITPLQPPIVPYKESVHLAGYNTKHPVIRLIEKSDNSNNPKPLLSSNIIKITVKVNGTQDFIVRGDNGILNHKQAFLPFGSNPVKEATLRIENPVIFKYLDESSVKVQLVWKGPDSLSTYYNSYQEGAGLNVSMPSFDYSTIKDYESLLTTWNPDMKAGFMQTTLNCNMGHSVFSNIYSTVAINNVNFPDKQKKFPNSPYTPEIQSLSLNYNASAELDYTTHEIFSIHPFGNVKLKEPGLLIEDTDNKGEVFFGIGNINKPSVLSLYLLLGDQTDNSGNTAEKNPPVWYYLKNNEWILFEKSEIIGDSTFNYTKSGIVYLNIPPEALTPHTLMPDGKVWLKLVFNDISMIPPLKKEKVVTQVVEASFINSDNELSHLDKGIPAGTISKPIIPIQGIKSVTQPYSSNGGRGIEDNKSYYTRVSERLRHKERAWNIWDYERLILEHFPEVFKVKCIPNLNQDGHFSPGNIYIVLIPDCNLISQKDIYKPVVSQALIYEVKAFIQSHCSPFVTLYVDNPCYEPVRVICNVIYKKEYSDKSYYNNQLNEDLKAFLAPWTSDPENFNFYRTLYKSQILYFIEQRPYVDYVDITNIKVMIEKIEVNDDQIIQPSNLNGILTTSLKHNINTPEKKLIHRNGRVRY